MLESYSSMAPEALASLTPEERHRVYGMLRLKVTAHSDGRLEADGMLAGGVSTNEITEGGTERQRSSRINHAQPNE